MAKNYTGKNTKILLYQMEYIARKNKAKRKDILKHVASGADEEGFTDIANCSVDDLFEAADIFICQSDSINEKEFRQWCGYEQKSYHVPTTCS